MVSFSSVVRINWYNVIVFRMQSFNFFRNVVTVLNPDQSDGS